MIGAIKSRVWKQKLLPVVAPVTWGGPSSISARETLVCLQEGLPVSPVHTHRLLCGLTEVSQRKLTVEVIWATLDSNRSRGTSDQDLICQVCALIQTHGGDKASHMERCEDDQEGVSGAHWQLALRAPVKTLMSRGQEWPFGRHNLESALCTQSC